jgi:hypothetical protein
MDDALLLESLKRIEGKVDTAIVSHGERIAKTETRLDAVEAAATKAEYKDWGRAVLTYLSVMLSHLGLARAGWKI